VTDLAEVFSHRGRGPQAVVVLLLLALAAMAVVVFAQGVEAADRGGDHRADLCLPDLGGARAQRGCGLWMRAGLTGGWCR